MYILEMASHQYEEILFISELLQAPVSKWGKVRSHGNEKDFFIFFQIKLNITKKGFTLSLALKVMVFGNRNWAMRALRISGNILEP